MEINVLIISSTDLLNVKITFLKELGPQMAKLALLFYQSLTQRLYDAIYDVIMQELVRK